MIGRRHLAFLALLSSTILTACPEPPTPPPTPPPSPSPGVLIGPDETPRIQCGSGRDATYVRFPGDSAEPIFGYNYSKVLSLGETHELPVITTLGVTGAAAGALLEWHVEDRAGGTFRVDGCRILYRAPRTLRGTAAEASVTFRVAIVTPSPPPSPRPGGSEGGPINVTGLSRLGKFTVRR